MFSRLQILLMCAGLLSPMILAASAADDDPVKKKFSKAKEDYAASISKLRADTLAWYDKKESKARADGKKKLADELKLQRDLFKDSEEWPLDMSTELQNRLQKSRTQLEVAFTTAIKDFLKAKKDDEAAAAEKELDEVRRSFWPILDLAKAQFKEVPLGSFRIPPNTTIFTKNDYKGGIEITLIAKTEAENIRLHAHKGSTVIFNWELNTSELRIHRPDGNFRGENASLGTAKVIPLLANTYYTLKWRLTPDGMTISNNGVIVFAEKKSYNLDIDTKVSIEAMKSSIDVKEFRVTPVIK